MLSLAGRMSAAEELTAGMRSFLQVIFVAAIGIAASPVFAANINARGQNLG